MNFEPDDAQYLKWNEANDANANGEATLLAERYADGFHEEEPTGGYDVASSEAAQGRRGQLDSYPGRDDADEHLAYNPHTDRYETGGDEIDFAVEGE